MSSSTRKSSWTSPWLARRDVFQIRSAHLAYITQDRLGIMHEPSSELEKVSKYGVGLDGVCVQAAEGRARHRPVPTRSCEPLGKGRAAPRSSRCSLLCSYVSMIMGLDIVLRRKRCYLSRLPCSYVPALTLTLLLM